MIDVRSEQLVPIAQAPAHVPGNRVHISAIYRWTRRRDNPLDTVLIGGRRYTSVEAILRFVANGSGHDSVHDQAAAGMTSRRTRQIQEAERRLDAAGVR